MKRIVSAVVIGLLVSLTAFGNLAVGGARLGRGSVFLNTYTSTSNIIDWSSAAATTAWATGSNWIGGVAPLNDTTTNIADFNQGSYTSQPNAGTTSVYGITVGSSSAALTLSGTALTLGSAGMVVTASSTTTISVPLAGSTTISNNGTGTLTLSGANTITGTINCASGATLRMGSTTGFGAASVVLAGGAIFGKTAGNITNANVNALSLAGVVNFDCAGSTGFTWGTGVITLTGPTEINVSSTGSSFTTTGQVAGSFSLTKRGVGTLTLNSASAAGYTNLYVNNGVFTIQNNGSVPTTAVFLGDTSGSNAATLTYVTGFSKPVTVRSGSSGLKTLKRQASNPTCSSAITLQTDVTIDGGGGNVVFTGGITGTGNVTYTNSSTGTLSVTTTSWNNVGDITFTGVSTGDLSITQAIGSNVVNLTNSSNGVLKFNSASGNTGAVTISSGGLGGTGSVKSNATITIPSGAVLYGGSGPGNAGTLTSNVGITLSSGANYTVNVGSTTTVSKVAITGNLTLNGNTVNFPAAALNAGTYTIFTYTGSVSGTLSIGTLPTGRTFASFTYAAGVVQVTFT